MQLHIYSSVVRPDDVSDDNLRDFQERQIGIKVLEHLRQNKTVLLSNYHREDRTSEGKTFKVMVVNAEVT